MIRYMIKVMLGSIPHRKLSFLSFTYSRTSRNWAWGCGYVSIVSIIFYCFMPILYNFHIFLATFYMIYWTNLLIQCPVPVPVFLHVFCIIDNSYQMKSKCDKNLWRIVLEYMWLLGGGINANGGPPSPQPTRARQAPLARPCVLCPPRRSVGALLLAQER